MDIKNAREILGKEAIDKTDEEIEKLIDTLKVFANIAVDTFMEMTPEQRKKFTKTPTKKLERSDALK